MKGKKADGNLFKALFLDCAVYDLRCHIPSMSKKLSAADIGMDEDDLPSEDLVTLGSKRIIPKKEIAKLEKIRVQAIKLMADNSMKFSFGSFIPKSKIEKVEQGLSEMKTEFDEICSHISSNFDAMKQEMMSKWEIEMVKIAQKRNLDETTVFMMLDRIDKAFSKGWEQHRASFTWVKYTDINDIAKDFIQASTMEVMGKLVEFATNLKDRLENGSLNDKNLAPVRKYIAAISESIKVLKSNQLENLVGEMEAWTLEGVSDDIKDSQNAKMEMGSIMDNVIKVGTEMADSIVKESIQGITSFSRTLEM